MRGEQPVGMDAATAALFPSMLVQTEQGETPEGWSRCALATVAELNPPRPIKKGATAPYVEMASLPTAGHRASEWPLREVASGARFENGDTLLARITPCLENGKTGFVDFLDEGQAAWGSTEYIVIRPRLPIPPEWAYLLARQQAFRDFAAQKMEGTSGRQRVSAASVGMYMVSRASEAVFRRFAELVSPLFRRISQNHDEQSVLATGRDALLPKLLSGELRVADAAQVVEEAA
jgi:type I restriction enzyme S subunit